MTIKAKNWLKITALCGVLTPIVAFACIALAILYYPPFSWTENALSDLGIQAGATAPLFNFGLIISGILALIFATGSYLLLGQKMTGKLGAFTFILATLALVAIGIFPENIKPNHYYASVAFFALVPLSMILLTASLLAERKVKTGLFTLLTAIVAATPWILYFSVHFVKGVAIPEMISGVSTSVWTIVLSFQMVKHDPIQPNNI
jgi:hypothetical membrane protein